MFGLGNQVIYVIGATSPPAFPRRLWSELPSMGAEPGIDSRRDRSATAGQALCAEDDPLLPNCKVLNAGPGGALRAWRCRGTVS